MQLYLINLWAAQAAIWSQDLLSLKSFNFLKILLDKFQNDQEEEE